MLSVDVLIVIAFAIYTAILAILRLDARIGIGTALALLVTAAIVLAMGNGDVASRLAMFACYFLASGGVLLLIEHIRGEGKRHEERATVSHPKQQSTGGSKRRRKHKLKAHQSREHVLSEEGQR